eukprot:6211951-Pleurochrysis_carterae.AAC.3
MWSLAGVAFRARVLARQNSSAPRETCAQNPGAVSDPVASAPREQLAPASAPVAFTRRRSFALSWNPTRAKAACTGVPFAAPSSTPSMPTEENDSAYDSMDKVSNDTEKEDSDCDVEQTVPTAAAPSRSSAYGASMYVTASRMWDEQESRRSAAINRSKRPSHREYSKRYLSDEAIRSAVTGTHPCRHKWNDEGEIVNCQHMLWARGLEASMEALRQQRKTFLNLSPKERTRVVLEAITFPTTSVLHGWKPPLQKPIFCVGIAADRRREVCREVFLSNFSHEFCDP